MAKKTNQEALYLLIIVGIVAAVGIFVLLMNSGTGEMVEVVDEDGNVVGMAYKSGNYRMLARGGGSGSACSSHSDCRGGHCNSNGRCA